MLKEMDVQGFKENFDVTQLRKNIAGSIKLRKVKDKCDVM